MGNSKIFFVIVFFSFAALFFLMEISDFGKEDSLSGLAIWWNKSWAYRQAINITEVGGVVRFNELVDAYATFPGGAVSNCTTELRIAKPNNFTRTYNGALITEDFNTITNTTKWLNTTVSGLSSLSWTNRELMYSISSGSSVAADSFIQSSQTFNVDADIAAEFLSIGNVGFPSNGAIRFGINLTNSTLGKSEFFSVDSVYNNLNVFHLNHSNTSRSTSIITNTVPWDYTTLVARYYQSRNNADFLLNGNTRKTINLTDEGFVDSLKNYNVSIFATGVNHGGGGYDLRIDNIRAYPVPIFNPAKFNITDNGTAVNNANVSIYFPNGTLVFSNNTSSDGIVALNLTNMSVFPAAAGIVLRNSSGQIVGSETIDSFGVEGLYPNDTWNFDINQPVEIISQVYNETYLSGSCVSANLVFESNVSANSNTTYHVFYKNSGAAAPSYGSNIYNSTASPDNNFYYGNFTDVGASIYLYLNDSSQRDTYGFVQMGSQKSFSNTSLISNGPMQAIIKLFENSSYGTYNTNVTIKKNRNIDYNSHFNFTANSGVGAGIDNNVLFYIMSNPENAFNNTISRGNVSAKANNEVNYGGVTDTRNAFFTNPDPTWIGFRTYGKYLAAFNFKPSFNTLLYVHDSGDPDRISVSETSGTLSGTQRYFNFTIVARDLQTADFPYWENVTENPLNISFGPQEYAVLSTTTTTTTPLGGPPTPSCKCSSPSEWSACVAGNQSRTNYNCGPSTSYSCISYRETRSCEIEKKNEINETKAVEIILGCEASKSFKVSEIAAGDISRFVSHQLPEAGGNIYKFLNVSGGCADGNKTLMKIKFTVDNSWIENNTISAETVLLKVLRNSKWEYISAEKIAIGENKTVYQATTDEFALFVITGKKLISANVLTEQPRTVSYSPIFLILFIIIAAGILIYSAKKFTKNTSARPQL